MRRGTTPTLTYDVDVDMTTAEVMYITLSQKEQTIIEKDIGDITITADRVSCDLTQQETLALSSLKSVDMQIRARLASGAALTSNIMSTHVGRVLKDGVI